MPVFNSNRNGKHAHVVHFPFGIAKKVDKKSASHWRAWLGKRYQEIHGERKSRKKRATRAFWRQRKLTVRQRNVSRKMAKKPTHVFARRALQHIRTLNGIHRSGWKQPSCL